MNWIYQHIGPLLFGSFCAITLIQLFYYSWFFARLAFYKEKERMQSQEHPVSIIVCARDEDENLARNLPGLLVQDYRSTHEIIVVNDNSVDDSKYILRELQEKFKKLQIVELTHEAKLIRGKKYPLSIGIKEARHEIVALTDADCVPASEFWLQKVQDKYQDNIEIVLGYGAYHKQPGLLNKLIRFETFHTALQYFSYALAGSPYMGVGRNLSYKKGLFLRNKGFSSINQLPGGDDDLFIHKVATSTNTAILIDKDAITLSQPKRNWKEWRGQKQRHYSTARYYRPKFKFLLGLYNLTQFLFYPFFVLSLLFFSWQLAIGVLAVRLLLLAIVWYKSMQKLDEADLWPFFIFFDLWLFVYYLIFAPTLWKKPRQDWT